MPITKRAIMGIIERIDSASKELPLVVTHAQIKKIVAMDLGSVKADLEYLMSIADD